jgi:hypothetical protein
MIATFLLDSKLVVLQAQSRASRQIAIANCDGKASTFKTGLAYAAAARIDGEEVAG